MSSGYSGTPLVRKLGIKAGMSIIQVNAPEHYADLLGPLPENTRILTVPPADFVHLFCYDYAELNQKLPQCKEMMTKSGMLWISWPKKSSSFYKDLDRDTIREEGLSIGLVDVKVCAIDEDWSGLKFVYRLADR